MPGPPPVRPDESRMTLYTIGHGSRPIGEFIALLRQARVECLVDVRAFPASRRHPQFARAALQRLLAEAGIRYAWEGKDLGGRRQPAGDSPHIALKEPGFRAYADHMMSGEFRAALDRLVELGAVSRAAIMCAERLPQECHRSLISDSLRARGAEVLHLIDSGPPAPHVFNPLARIEGEALVYDGGRQLPLL